MTDGDKARQDLIAWLQGRFPDARDKKLVSDLLFLRSAGEDLRSFGKVMVELLSGSAGEDLEEWKIRLLVQCLDSIAWIGRLTSSYGEAVMGLTIHLRRTAPEEEEKKADQLKLGLTETIERLVP